MAKKLPRNTAIEIAVGDIQCGLSALHELALSHENGVTGETLSVCVESLTTDMQSKTLQILDLLYGSPGVTNG